MDYIGTSFGNYTLVRHLGQGSFSEVYLGVNNFLPHDLVAIKVLINDDITEFYTMRELQRYVQTSTRVCDFGIKDGVSYIVMEYYEKGTINRVTGMQIRNYSFLARLVLDIGAVLQFLHDDEYTHRDVKPSNMYFDKEGVLLGDYGIMCSCYDPSSAGGTY